MSEPEIHDAILQLLARRRPGASICPSEIARGTGRDDWRSLMPAIRSAAAELARQGRLGASERRGAARRCQCLGGTDPPGLALTASGVDSPACGVESPGPERSPTRDTIRDPTR